jgi:uncharacterized membrane protein
MNQIQDQDEDQNKYIMFIGRWNPLSESDIKLFNKHIENKDKILICVVDTELSESLEETPLTIEDSQSTSQINNLRRHFQDHLDSKQVIIKKIPKIFDSPKYESGYLPNKIFNTHSFYIIKALSWRAIGTLDTILLGWLVTGNPLMGLTIGAYEFITKTTLYYIHDLVWDKCLLKYFQNGCKRNV